MCDQIAKILAVHQLHGNEGDSIFFTHFVNSYNVGMLERSRGLRFTIKALQQRRAVCYIGLDLFESNQSIDDWVSGLIHDAHGAAAQLFKDLVFAQFLQITPLPKSLDKCGRDADPNYGIVDRPHESRGISKKPAGGPLKIRAK